MALLWVIREVRFEALLYYDAESRSSEVDWNFRTASALSFFNVPKLGKYLNLSAGAVSFFRNCRAVGQSRLASRSGKECNSNTDWLAIHFFARNHDSGYDGGGVDMTVASCHQFKEGNYIDINVAPTWSFKRKRVDFRKGARFTWQSGFYSIPARFTGIGILLCRISKSLLQRKWGRSDAIQE